METFLNIGEVILRSLASIITLFLLTKLMGKKQISQLNFFDYVIGISIGSIAGEFAYNLEIPFYYHLIAMALYALFDIFIGFITCKSIKLRRFLTGEPLILINKGKILEKNMLSVKMDINDLLTECRNSGYFNVSDIYYAIIETNGKLSFLPKSSIRPANPSDLNLNPEQEEIVANVIIDGKIMDENLKLTGKNEEWLMKELEAQHLKNIKDIILATCDNKNQLSVFLKSYKKDKNNIFE